MEHLIKHQTPIPVNVQFARPQWETHCQTKQRNALTAIVHGYDGRELQFRLIGDCIYRWQNGECVCETILDRIVSVYPLGYVVEDGEFRTDRGWQRFRGLHDTTSYDVYDPQYRQGPCGCNDHNKKYHPKLHLEVDIARMLLIAALRDTITPIGIDDLLHLCIDFLVDS